MKQSAALLVLSVFASIAAVGCGKEEGKKKFIKLSKNEAATAAYFLVNDLTSGTSTSARQGTVEDTSRRSFSSHHGRVELQAATSEEPVTLNCGASGKFTLTASEQSVVIDYDQCVMSTSKDDRIDGKTSMSFNEKDRSMKMTMEDFLVSSTNSCGKFAYRSNGEMNMGAAAAAGDVKMDMSMDVTTVVEEGPAKIKGSTYRVKGKVGVDGKASSDGSATMDYNAAYEFALNGKDFAKATIKGTLTKSASCESSFDSGKLTGKVGGHVIEISYKGCGAVEFLLDGKPVSTDGQKDKSGDFCKALE